MSIKFTKMHGLGNDFVVIDLISQRMQLEPKLISYMANRHFGIGFDQLLIVEAPTKPNIDFKYRIFNADGAEVAQCGNGARCFARFVREQGLTRKSVLLVETLSGIIELSITDDGWVRVDMGKPSFTPNTIPFTETVESLTYTRTVAEEAVTFSVVNVGNPHAVITVDDVLTAPVQTVGALLESHVDFPERVNVGFMQILSRNEIRLRVFERGAGETLACGTGACAAVVAGIRQGLLDSDVRVQLQGGMLHIQWQEGQNVIMIGPTSTVFTGQFDVENLGVY